MNATLINFRTSKADAALIRQVVARTMRLCARYDIDQYPSMDCDMDITACHANGMPLDLKKLLEADDFNFAHDVFGIRRHINRTTGQIENCFVPRYSKGK